MDVVSEAPLRGGCEICMRHFCGKGDVSFQKKKEKKWIGDEDEDCVPFWDMGTWSGHEEEFIRQIRKGERDGRTWTWEHTNCSNVRHFVVRNACVNIGTNKIATDSFMKIEK